MEDQLLYVFYACIYRSHQGRINSPLVTRRKVNHMLRNVAVITHFISHKDSATI